MMNTSIKENEDCDLGDSLRIPLDSDDDYFDDIDGDYSKVINVQHSYVLELSTLLGIRNELW